MRRLLLAVLLGTTAGCQKKAAAINASDAGATSTVGAMGKVDSPASGATCNHPSQSGCHDLTLLTCDPDTRTWREEHPCRGKAGCSGQGVDVVCDQSLAQENDACPTTGRLACSMDGSAELQCQNGHFRLSRRCDKDGCSVSGGGGVRCR